jgi:hypothetical protein
MVPGVTITVCEKTYSTAVPDVPVIVMVYLPTGTVGATIMSAVLCVLEGLGAKLIVIPAGAPE